MALPPPLKEEIQILCIPIVCTFHREVVAVGDEGRGRFEARDHSLIGRLVHAVKQMT